MQFEQHAAGTFSWCDYTAVDREAACAFYNALWAWQYRDVMHNGQVVYSLIERDGLIVGGLPVPRPARKHGSSRASWQTYVAVDDVEEYTTRAAESGGTVLAQNIACGDYGWFSLIRDPQGVTFGLWQPGTLQGVQVKHATGTLMWTELNVRDVPAAKSYYHSVFGWKAEDEQQPTTMYTRFQYPSEPVPCEVAGLLGIDPAWEDHPPQWMVYFGVDDVADTLEQAQALGGTAIMGPMEVPTGIIGIIMDPWGAMMYIQKPNTPADA